MFSQIKEIGIGLDLEYQKIKLILAKTKTTLKIYSKGLKVESG